MTKRSVPLPALCAWRRLLAAACLLLTAPACSHVPVTRQYGRATITTSSQQPDPAHIDQLGRVASRLAEASAARGLDRPWGIVLTDSRVPNAGAVCSDDGDALMVTEALFAITQTDGGLAAAVAHEMGHLALGHGAERRHESALSGDHSPAWCALSRHHELEADAWGFRLMKAAGYDPREMIRAWRRYEAWQISAGGPLRPPPRSPHPSWEERVKRLESMRRR